MGVKVKVGPKYQVVIPQGLREKVALAPKNEVLVEEIHGVILILPQPKSFSAFMFGLGKESWKGIDPKKYVRKERADWK
jgi:AbrB family looped-hinge helix DNA binding protein